MNIDKTSGTSLNPYQKQMQVSKVAKAKRSENEDQLQISKQAKQMYEKQTKLDEDRQNRIETLKAQIQSGQYRINSHKVADKVYRFWFGQ